MDYEKENLSIILNLNKSKIISDKINSFNDFSQNFCFLKESTGDTFLIWATTENVLEVYNLNLEFVVDRVKAHEDDINSCHHFYDPIKNKDFIITSSDDKTIKIWEFIENNSLHSKSCKLKNILTIKQDTIGNFRNAYMFTDFEEKKNYIVVELSDYLIAIYNENGQYLRKIDGCIFFDIWSGDTKIYIVTSYAGKTKLYDYKTTKVWKEFKSKGKSTIAAVINNLLISADDEGFITTFDIHTGEIMNQIQNDTSSIIELTVWDLEYLFVATSDGNYHCYETKTLTKVRTLENIGINKVLYGLSFIHPKYGVSLAISGPTDSDKAVMLILSSVNDNRNIGL